MESRNREFTMAYSQEEMHRRVEELKNMGYRENDIHVLVHDDAVLGATTDLNGIHTHETGSTGSKFKSFFTGRDTVREELKRLDLEERQIDTYQDDLENGAILLYTEGAAPSGSRNYTDSTTRHASNPANLGSEEIYTSETTREEQYGQSAYGNNPQDSRVKGENIHPTTGGRTMDETAPEEKLMEHEPGLGENAGSDLIDGDDGVRRRQDDQSPGIDPNLGPAPFGRDSEEEHLLNDHDQDNSRHRSDRGPYDEDRDKRPGTPPTPKLF